MYKIRRGKSRPDKQGRRKETLVRFKLNVHDYVGLVVVFWELSHTMWTNYLPFGSLATG